MVRCLTCSRFNNMSAQLDNTTIVLAAGPARECPSCAGSLGVVSCRSPVVDEQTGKASEATSRTISLVSNRGRSWKVDFVTPNAGQLHSTALEYASTTP